ncbi:hypothetical protein [Bdellovibrio sp. HCB337]|uniref:hypothetical protein n=1 Tax=Bdellovibrio sp. HCB337 TaxID=3394358 RepID=UPI0039A604CC
MTKIFVTTFLAMATLFSTQAFANPTTKRDIYNLAREIQDALVDTTASDSNLISAKEQLEKALDLIQRSGNGGSPVSDACVKFAYEKYYKMLNTSDSMTKAGQACRKTDSLEVMEYLYEKMYQTLNSVDAMDRAAEASQAPIAGKLEIVKFAYDMYYKQLNAADSAKRAADGARRVDRNAKSCLDTAYNNYYRSQNSADAMDSAFNFCANY